MTANTFDAYSWQLIEQKQKFIGQIMTSKAPARAMEDVDSAALSYAEVKALAAGNPDIKRKMDLEIETARLKTLRASYEGQQRRMEALVHEELPQKLAQQAELIRQSEQDAAAAAATENDAFAITVGGRSYGSVPKGEAGIAAEKAAAGQAILTAAAGVHDTQEMTLGSYRGFRLSLYYDLFQTRRCVRLTGAGVWQAELGDDAGGTITRLDNLLDRIPTVLEQQRARLETLKQEAADAAETMGKPWPQETEYRAKLAELKEVDLRLSAQLEPQTAEAVQNIQPEL